MDYSGNIPTVKPLVKADMRVVTRRSISDLICGGDILSITDNIKASSATVKTYELHANSLLFLYSKRDGVLLSINYIDNPLLIQDDTDFALSKGDEVDLYVGYQSPYSYYIYCQRHLIMSWYNRNRGKAIGGVTCLTPHTFLHAAYVAGVLDIPSSKERKQKVKTLKAVSEALRTGYVPPHTVYPNTVEILDLSDVEKAKALFFIQSSDKKIAIS